MEETFNVDEFIGSMNLGNFGNKLAEIIPLVEKGVITKKDSDRIIRKSKDLNKEMRDMINRNDVTPLMEYLKGKKSDSQNESENKDKD